MKTKIILMRCDMLELYLYTIKLNFTIKVKWNVIKIPGIFHKLMCKDSFDKINITYNLQVNRKNESPADFHTKQNIHESWMHF